MANNPFVMSSSFDVGNEAMPLGAMGSYGGGTGGNGFAPAMNGMMAPMFDSTQQSMMPGGYNGGVSGFIGTHGQFADEDDQNVRKLRENDVLLGRGGGTNNHVGNIRFRKLVNEHKMRYMACSKVDKPKVAREVVQIWRKLNPPGRFLARKDQGSAEDGDIDEGGEKQASKTCNNDNEKREANGSAKNKPADAQTEQKDIVWYEVGDKKANAKASQCLRERTPDVMPYLRQLREQQDRKTEQGVLRVGQQQQQQAVMQNQDPRLLALARQQGMMEAGGGPQMQMGYESNPYTAVCQQQQMGMQGGRPGVMGGEIPMVAESSMGMYSQQGMGPNEVDGSMAPPTGGMMGGKGPAFYDDMSDLEYEQSVMMMQQEIQMQQMQLQRIQQQRAMQRAAMQRQHQQVQQQMPQLSQSDPAFPENGDGTMVQQRSAVPSFSSVAASQPVESVPQGVMKSRAMPERVSSHRPNRKDAAPRNPPKRSVSGSSRRRAAPDRTPSGFMSIGEDDGGGELTLEAYRQQLEDYIASNQGMDDDGDADGNNNSDEESDLEDDWEQERAKASAVQGSTRSRGVNRTKSGASKMSSQTNRSSSNKSQVSMFSHMSGLSDLMATTDHTKGREALERTQSSRSHLSMMSELTDLSQNMDELSIR